MSRDWKPFEFVLADEEAFASRGEHLHDMKVAYREREGGEEIPMYTYAARKAFPNLSFLLNGFETNAYAKADENAAIYCAYKEIEADVAVLVSKLREQVSNKERLCLDEVCVAPVVRDWFLGELDRSFYYNDENDAALYRYAEELAASLRFSYLDHKTDRYKVLPIKTCAQALVRFENSVCLYDYDVERVTEQKGGAFAVSYVEYPPGYDASPEADYGPEVAKKAYGIHKSATVSADGSVFVCGERVENVWSEWTREPDTEIDEDLPFL